MEKYKIEFKDVITYSNYYDALKLCNTSVNYKFSVQQYNLHNIEKIRETIDTIRKLRIPTVKKSEKVVINERGKKRIITPIIIDDRVTQRVLCDNVLLPSIVPHLIYDNAASIKDRGTDFARRRINKFIEDAKREYGANNLYALVFDFKSYFDNIEHEQCYRVLKKYIYDEDIVDLTIGIIESYKLDEINKIEDIKVREEEICKLYNHKYRGVCLGSEISQIMAVAVPNDIDHYIKDKLGMKYYVRYMDDGVIIFNSKEKLIEIKHELEELNKKYGVKFNSKKTCIVKLTKGFTFLKTKYNVTSEGETIKRLKREGIVRERKKLKKFKGKVDNGKMSMDDVYQNIQSWNAHSKIARSYRTQKEMFRLYDDLYGGYRMTRKYYNNNPDIKRKRKVVRL
jgi:hypothetical protein